MGGRTISERTFEAYLASRGIAARYEELPDGVTRPVDYSFEIDGTTVRCEVKEWAPKGPASNIGCFDPYEPIRDKIGKAREKFQQYRERGEPCVLVLCNPGAGLVTLDEMSVIGAMMGDIGRSMPFNPQTGIADAGLASLTSVASGSMLRQTARGGRVQNTTISAVAVLGSINRSARRIGIHIRQKENALQRALTVAERSQVVADVFANAPREVEARLAVYDNIDAAVPLQVSFPTGPLDERVGQDGKRLRRIYVGAEIAAIEAEELSVGLVQEDLLGLRRVR